MKQAGVNRKCSKLRAGPDSVGRAWALAAHTAGNENHGPN